MQESADLNQQTSDFRDNYEADTDSARDRSTDDVQESDQTEYARSTGALRMRGTDLPRTLERITIHQPLIQLVNTGIASNTVKDPGTALIETKPIQVYTNENHS